VIAVKNTNEININSVRVEKQKVTEGTKTGAMAIVAGVIGLLAWGTSSRNSYAPVAGTVGATVFEKFTDPMTAASLKILRYDKPKEDYVEFEVAQDRKSGIWTIPSHESYPADASKQMSQAANLFVGLKTLGIASTKRADQVLFGVVEPNKQNADKGGEGVGTLVQMRDTKGDILADLIIGKDNDKNQRFVRVPSTDVIYVVDLDTAPLSTDFKQWIEADLLKLSSNDIETIGIRDYQIVPVNQGLALSKNYEADLSFATANGQWQATKITNFESNPPVERTLGPDEQLNASKLNDMKSALDNLRIADVAKKPAGLAGDLKGNKTLLSNKESINSLQRRGFFPDPNQKDGDVVDFFSKSGELVVTLKDGVQYLLRFGGPAGAEITASDKKETNEEEKAEDIVSINRFLLVTAKVDDSKFPQPDLERLPETVDEIKAIENLKKQPPVEVGVPPSSTPPSEPATSEPATSEPATSEPATSEPAAKPETSEKPADAKPAPEPKAEETPVEEKPADPKPAEEKPQVDVPADKPESVSLKQSNREGKLVSFQDPQAPQSEVKQPEEKKTDEPVATPEPTEEEWKERLEAAREKITKENTRKIDLRNEKLLVAKKKVAELNARFADWYYVVSEDDYKKMRISLTDLVQPKTASAPSGGGAPGFNPAAGFPGFPQN
jgi:Domain of unknown function (DUF4340)